MTSKPLPRHLTTADSMIEDTARMLCIEKLHTRWDLITERQRNELREEAADELSHVFGCEDY